MITVNASRREPICLRHQGENDAMRVAFPLSAFEADWPGGTPLLLVQRPRASRDTEAYPVALSVDGHTAYWTVSASDVEYSGYGKAQLQWRVEDVFVKSCIYDTVCVPSLHAGAEPPDEPSKRWFDAIQAQIGDISKLTTKAKDNLVAAINEAARSGGGSGGAGTIDMRAANGYIQYSNDDGATWKNLIAIADLKGADGKNGITPTIGENGNWHLGDEDTGKPSRGATGPQGADGHTPVITASKSGKVTTIKADGEAIATVNDGADGTNGTDGAPGKDGVTPDIKIGTVTTLPAGSAATASMGGTAAQPTLNLGIPKGANGDDANVTKDAVVGALGFTPIGADDVPVKSVNGATGEIKSAFYVTVTPTGSGHAATADKTAAEVYEAYVAGYAVYAVVKFASVTAPFELPLVAAAPFFETFVLGFGALGSLDPTAKPQYPTAAYTGTAWMAWLGTLARSSDIPTIPTELKNPHSLNIKIGDTTTSYDGSAAKTVEIPEGTDGYSPSASVTQTDDGAKITITDKTGTTEVEVKNGPQGPAGADYVLTDADKTEIAKEVIAGGVEATLGPVPLPAPATAAVGQIIKVKTVDESGKVTGTEAVDMPQGGGANISLGVTGAAVGQLVKISEVDADGKPTAWEAFDPAKWTKIGDTIDVTDAGFPVCMAFPDAYSELIVIGQLFIAESSKTVYAAITPGASNYSMQRIVTFNIGTHPYGTAFRIMAHNYTETETTIKISAEAYTSQSGEGFGSASATTKLKSMQKTSAAAGTNGYISIFTDNEIAVTSGNIEVYAR
mgnify:CR=1 FL=1